MIQREELEGALIQFFNQIHFDKKKFAEVEERLVSKRKMLSGSVAGVLSQTDDLSKVSDEELYWYADASDLSFDFKQYFSPNEIKMYSTSKNQILKSIFPLSFENVIQVGDRQFLTTITSQRLYEFYKHQIVIYNLNTQRNPKIVIKDGEEKLIININRRSVASIISLLKRNLFVPNALTFNIREERNGAEYEYDEDNAELIVFNNGFDIIDGYHRYLALTRVMDENPDFNFTFILNIVNFTEEEARRYIAQEDKRNKINSSYSKSLDTTKYESILVSRLNGDSASYLYGQIQAIKNAKIDAGKMITIIGQILTLRSNADVVATEKKLCEYLNKLFDLNTDYLYDFSISDMRVALCCFAKLGDNDSSIKSAHKYIQYFREPDYKPLSKNTNAILKHIKAKEVKS